MKRFCATIALCVGFFATVQAQTTPAISTTASPEMMKLDSLTKLSQRFLNEQKVDSLYALMGKDFKSQVSSDMMKQVSSQVSGQLGKWTTTVPVGIKDGIAKYKATFTNATLDFYISRDAEGKISTFLMKPSE